MSFRVLRRFVAITNLVLLGLVAWQGMALGLSCLGSYLPCDWNPPGCTVSISQFFACSTRAPNCCQYAYVVRTYSGCSYTPNPCTDRVFLGTHANETCEDPPGECSGWDPP